MMGVPPLLERRERPAKPALRGDCLWGCFGSVRDFVDDPSRRLRELGQTVIQSLRLGVPNELLDQSQGHGQNVKIGRPHILT